MGYSFSSNTRKGSENSAADALSRVGHAFAAQAVSTAQPIWLQEVANSYVVDKDAHELLQKLAVDASSAHPYSLTDGILRYQDKFGLVQT